MTFETPRRGFQASVRTTVKVEIYPQSGDPIVVNSSDLYFQGKRGDDRDHTLVSVQTEKTLKGAGTFQLVLKPGKGIENSLFDDVMENDWIDISFVVEEKTWHTMRGLIDRIQRRTTLAGTGATTTTYVIVGRDFQKIWQSAPIWYDAVSQTGTAVPYRLGQDNITGVPPDEMTRLILFELFKELPGGGNGGTNWTIPDRVPSTSQNFLDNVEFNTDGWSDHPQRRALLLGLTNVAGTVWDLAEAWADLGFTELWCDLGVSPLPLSSRAVDPADDSLPISQSSMVVFFRDKPFPLTVDQGSPNLDTGHPNTGENSNWFALPQFIVPRAQITEEDAYRSGEERINSFHVSQQVLQMIAQVGPIELSRPLRDLDSIGRHGMRRYDVSSKYISDEANLLTLARSQRAILRDWFSANPYLLSGSLALSTCRPEIRVGSRVKVPALSGGHYHQDEYYYVESVGHTWTFGNGKTTLGVSRGYTGKSTRILDIIEKLRGEFQE